MTTEWAWVCCVAIIGAMVVACVTVCAVSESAVSIAEAWKRLRGKREEDE